MARAPRPTDTSTRGETQPDRLHPGTGTSPERVAQRAYERYEARGREDGHDLADWYEAERELQQTPSGTTTTAAGEVEAESETEPDQVA